MKHKIYNKVDWFDHKDLDIQSLGMYLKSLSQHEFLRGKGYAWRRVYLDKHNITEDLYDTNHSDPELKKMNIEINSLDEVVEKEFNRILNYFISKKRN